MADGGGREARRGVAAILFHHVGPARPGAPPSLTVSASRFEGFLDYLVRARYTTIGLDQLGVWIDGSAPLPRRSVLLTFDDGYADLATHAFPALRRRRQRAVVFVPSAFVGGRNEWDGPGDNDGHRLLGVDDLRSWSQQGIDFGAHGRTHRDLCVLDGAELHEELVAGREELEAVLGRPVTALAYPYGTHDAAVRSAAASSRYRLAFGVEEGLNRRDTDRLGLRRTMVQPGDGVADVAFRCRLGFSPLQKAKARVARSRP